jgi:hypothetical protein
MGKHEQKSAQSGQQQQGQNNPKPGQGGQQQGGQHQQGGFQNPQR